ncbi:MAG: MGMT family protein [Candidatus Nezhaarchaeota archaeon]|nr:MGMT family protein [Candidatus Nezhaarchaeota archaeon]
MHQPVQGFMHIGRVGDKYIAAIIDRSGRLISLSLLRKSEEEALNEAKAAALIKVSYKFKSEMDPAVRRTGKEVVEFLELYLEGKRPSAKFELSREGLSDFMEKVLSIVTLIPYGSVTCYGSIAELIGNRNASRAVGAALARNPWPIIIPCHRVVRCDRGVGGYKGGVELKKHLLRVEGVAITASGKVLPSHFINAKQLGIPAEDIRAST